MRRVIFLVSMLAVILFLLVSCSQQAKDFTYTTKSSEAREYFNQGLEKIDELQLDEARGLLDQAIAADPEFAMAYYYRAQAAVSPADFRAQLKEAMTYKDKATEPEQLAIMAMKANSEDNPGEARQHLVKLVELLPESKRAHYILGIFYYGQQEWLNAEKELYAATGIDPEFAPPYNMLGYAYSNQYKYEDAIKALQKYSELRPEDPNPHDSMGEIYLYMSDHENSIKAYNASLKIDPTFNASHAGIGHNFCFTGKCDEARDHYNYYRTQGKSVGDTNIAYFWIATSYVHQGKYDKAIEVSQEQLNFAKERDNAVAQGNVCGQIANIYLNQGKYNKALEEAEKMREYAKDPDIQVAAKEGILRGCNFIEAQLYSYQGKKEMAQKCMDEYKVSAEESNSEVNVANWHGLVGIVAFINKDYMTAISEFEKSNQLNQYTKYYHALTLEKADQLEKSKEVFKDVAGWNRNGFVYALVRDKAKAKI